jgi:hypothetical protein
MKKFSAKKKGFGLAVRTFTGKRSGSGYIVFRTPKGSFHVFVETQAKAAARDCGGIGANTRQQWKSIW